MRSLGAAVLLAVSLPAQSWHWPAEHATVEGNSATSMPFSIDPSWTFKGSRVVIFVSAATVPVSPPTTIRGIAFRRDGADPRAYMPLSGWYQIRMASVPDALAPVAGPREPFLGQPPLLARGNISIGAEPPPTSGTAPFSLYLPFQTPWMWTGGDFAIDLAFQSTNATPAPWHCDAVWLQPTVEARVEPIAPGCKAPERPFEPLLSVNGRDTVVGGSAHVRLQGAPPVLGSRALLLIGLPGTPLPLPGLVQPECTLQLRPAPLPRSYLTAVSDNSLQFGYASTGNTLSIPAIPSLHFGSLGVQWAVEDSEAGGLLGLSFSNGAEVKIGLPAPSDPGWGRSFWGYQVANIGTNYTGRLGPRNYVPVIEFR